MHRLNDDDPDTAPEPEIENVPAFPLPFHVLQGVGLDQKPRMVREMTPAGGMSLLLYLVAHAPRPPLDSGACDSPADSAAFAIEWARQVLKQLRVPRGR